MLINDDPYPYWDYLAQGQIGQMLGVSSHEIGRWLFKLGLRNRKGPSEEALATKLAKPVENGPAGFYCWQKERIVELLVNAGCGGKISKDGPADQPTPVLKGPYFCRPSGEGGDGYEIVSGNGTVGIWTRGQGNAQRLTALLNLAYEHGRF